MSKIKGNNIEIENALSINGIPINLLGGSGSGEAQSYITTGRSAESVGDLSAWTIYSNTPGVNPVNGFGGSPNITLTRNTTNPLSGLGDFRITKDAVNRQGQGISIPFTVDNRHLARVLQISFDYETISGILGQDNVRVSIIGDPNGTPFLIEPVNTSIEFPTIGNRSKHIATFQTNFSVKEYRLCIHISSTTTEAFVISFNNFRVWEQDQNYGAIITDWVSYTPNTIRANTTNRKFLYSKNGGNIKISFGWEYTSGVSDPTSALLSDIFPPGLNIDLTKLAPAISTLSGYSRYQIGQLLVNDYGVSNNLLAIVWDTNQTPDQISFLGSGGLNGANDNITGWIECPIQGWGSNLALSSVAGDGRECLAIYKNCVPGITSSSGFNWDTKVEDSHNAVVATSEFIFTAPFASVYDVSGAVISGSVIPIILEKNGSTYGIIGYHTNPGNGGTFSGQVKLNAGDYIKIKTTHGTSGTAPDAIICIRSSSSNQIIASNETVACSYYSAATQTSLTTQINFGTKLYDTHGAVTTGAGWKFTPPMAGKYRISGFNSGSATNLYLKLYKNGISYATICHVTDGTESYSIEVDLLSTDFIDIRPSGSLTVNGHANYNHDLASRIEISRIGI